MGNENKRMLEVKNLKTQFYTDEGIIKAIDGITFHVDKGETLGVVGESGSGKSVTALSIIRLVSGKIVEGEVLLDGKSLLGLSEKEMRSIRGNKITMIFQDPMTSLDPVYTIGFQLREAILKHRRISRDASNKIAMEILKKVGIPHPEARINNYPHQLSGGMRQRVMIAMALMCNPELLIADEPTTALDVTIQAQILDLIKTIKEEMGMSLLLITHDLGVIAEMCDRVAVMYCGKIVEMGTIYDIFNNPRHEYTKGLLASIPKLNEKVSVLHTIPGTVPNLTMLPEGCYFCGRCDAAKEECKHSQPPMLEVEPGHFAACFRG